MASSQSFAVWLPLFLLGTMAIVAVFLPIGCLAGIKTGEIDTDAFPPSSGPIVAGPESFSDNPYGVAMSSISNLSDPSSLSYNKRGLGRFSSIIPPRATDNDEAGNVDQASGKTEGHAHQDIVPKSPVMTSAKAFSLKTLEAMAVTETLAKNIKDKYAITMKVPDEDLDTDENLNTAIEVMMSMSVNNRAEHRNQERLKYLAIALGIREQYKNLLPEYNDIKKKEEGHMEANRHNILGNVNPLDEKKNKLAYEVFKVLALGNQGTGNPKEQAHMQVLMAGSAINVLSMHSGVGEDVLSNGIHENALVKKKAELLLELRDFVKFLGQSEVIFAHMNDGGSQKVDRCDDAMKVLEIFQTKMIEAVARPSHAHHHVGEGTEGAHPPAPGHVDHNHHEHAHRAAGNKGSAVYNGGNGHNPNPK